jgi:hypothetical protein
MANEEGVKIIITAEDRFTETMKKIDASSKIFGETTKNTQRHLEALEKEMVRLVANGLDPADKKIKEMKANYDKLSQSLNGGDASLKKSNQQWTNLALVIQDLPYGFRGIQNNLPALIGGFAGVSGAAYVLGSALIAIWTAYGDTITEVIFKTNALDKANKQLQEGMVDSVKSTSSAREELFKVAAVIKAGKDNLIDKTAALDYYNKKLGVTYGTATTLEEAEAKMIEKTPKYIEAIGLKAKAQFYYAKAAEYAIKGDLAGLEDQTTAFDKLIAFGKAFQGITAIGPKQLIKSIVASLSVAQNKAIDKIANQSQLIGDILFKNGNDAMDQYFKGLKAAGLSDQEIADIFKKFQAARDKLADVPTLEDPNIKLLEATIKAKQAEIQLSKDDYNQKAKLQLDLLDLQKEYDLLKLHHTKYTEKEKAKIALQIEQEYANKRFEIYDKKDASIFKVIEDSYANRILLANGNLDKEKAIYQEELYWLKQMLNAKYVSQEDYEKKVAVLQNKFAAIDKKQLDNKEKDAKERIDREFKAQMDAVNLRLKAQLKGHNKEPLKKQEDYQQAIAGYVAIGLQAGLTTEQVDKLQGAINGVNSEAKGTAAAFTPMANILNNLATNTLVEFGTQLGNMLSGGEFSLNGFLTLLADAIIEIGKHLLIVSGLFAAVDALFKAPGMWPVAIAVGVAAIAAGTALKNSAAQKNPVTKFANGGIISGPTMGLMGEYPGAKSNPEVVAPLDKLKDLIGGGGGSLEARISGNDLLILMNKAQRNNNTTF